MHVIPLSPYAHNFMSKAGFGHKALMAAAGQNCLQKLVFFIWLTIDRNLKLLHTIIGAR